MVGVMRTSSQSDTPRKQRAVDAAIEVIAADGLRGLTHRAVDSRAGLPPGSTSSCFRSRRALLAGVLDRLVELDEARLATVHAVDWGIETEAQVDAVVDMLTDLLLYWLGPARERTYARLELYLDAPRHPELAAALAEANRRFLTLAADGIRRAGVADPDEPARILVACLDGLLYDALARPFLHGAERPRLRRAVAAVIAGLR